MVRPSEKLSEGMNRKPGSKSCFLGRRHISTSGFGSTATETAVFALFCQYSPVISVLDGTNGLSSSKPFAYCRTAWSKLKPEVVLATIIDP